MKPNDAERIGDVLEERHDELGLRRQVASRSAMIARGRDADHRLPEELRPAPTGPSGLRCTTLR